MPPPPQPPSAAPAMTPPQRLLPDFSPTWSVATAPASPRCIPMLPAASITARSWQSPHPCRCQAVPARRHLRTRPSLSGAPWRTGLCTPCWAPSRCCRFLAWLSSPFVGFPCVPRLLPPHPLLLPLLDRLESRLPTSSPIPEDGSTCHTACHSSACTTWYIRQLMCVGNAAGQGCKSWTDRCCRRQGCPALLSRPLAEVHDRSACLES
mmetsp:Transcript_3767/g.9538  ORF Transcript_3767/g.9538 Transcript_3767/m.9538 type:complete len:208 (-) Transcript_3767:221-844(-)